MVWPTFSTSVDIVVLPHALFLSAAICDDARQGGEPLGQFINNRLRATRQKIPSSASRRRRGMEKRVRE